MKASVVLLKTIFVTIYVGALRMKACMVLLKAIFVAIYVGALRMMAKIEVLHETWARSRCTVAALCCKHMVL